MHNAPKWLASIALILFTACSQKNNTTTSTDDGAATISADSLKQYVSVLASDSFMGRKPFTEGETKTIAYLQQQFKAAGLEPANGNSYIQEVPMVSILAKAAPSMDVVSPKGTFTLKAFDDYIIWTDKPDATESLDKAELVFAGYGVVAPEYNWNDYAGLDVKGKVVMVMVNDPGYWSGDTTLFKGTTMTYYGRWTYKFEEAARRGAAGVILIHTTESAGYGWNVVRTSNGNWRYEIARTANDKTPFLQIKSWATNETAERILKSANLDLNDLRSKAATRGFKSVNTGLKVKLNLKSEMQTFDSPNVVGTVSGSDTKLKSEYVIYSAHWDHLGIGEPDAKGDKIYNGAYDNASGVAAVLGIAEVLAKLPKKQRPKRSVMFLFPTAEEQGLLGAEYYSQNPLVPLAKTAGNVNIDGVNFFGKVSDFSALGAERSSITSVISEVAKERKLTVEGDTKSEQGFFFRSDHFPFAKVGVPAISLRHGDAFVRPLSGEAVSFFRDYTAKYYHQTSDEFHDWWDVSAMIQEAELGLAIGLKLANAKEMPRYNDTDEFSAADKKRFLK